MEIPKYFYFRVRATNKGTSDSLSVGVELEDASDVDVVEVIRCKDCKWHMRWDGKLGCGWHGFYETESDWFCADGERREDEAD